QSLHPTALLIDRNQRRQSLIQRQRLRQRPQLRRRPRHIRPHQNETAQTRPLHHRAKSLRVHPLHRRHHHTARKLPHRRCPHPQLGRHPTQLRRRRHAPRVHPRQHALTE